MTTLNEIMSSDVESCAPDATVSEAAQKMRHEHIGDVIISEDGQLRGLLTDRDIVVRVVAEGKNPETTLVSKVCSEQLHWLSPEAEFEEAVALMRTQSIRRLPIVDDEQVVGVVSLGDLALARDQHSALAEISAAAPNE